jgi:hypothetical protein
MRDERYALFIRHAGFLLLARLLTGGLLMIDSTVLTTLVDQWRSETHMFHLPCGETTVMVQDVTMILGLHIDDNAGLWDGVSRRVEGLHQGCYRPATP